MGNGPHLPIYLSLGVGTVHGQTFPETFLQSVLCMTCMNVNSYIRTGREGESEDLHWADEVHTHSLGQIFPVSSRLL